jgi:WD40 repeat protein
MKYCILLLTLCCFQVADAQNVSLVIPTGHGTTITKIQFSGNGKILASSSEDGTVKLWDTEFYREKGVFYNDTGKQAGLFFDSKAEVVFSCNTGGHLVGYNIRKSTVTHSSYLGRVKSVSSVNDSLLLVLSSRDAALKIYNLNQSTFIDIYQGVLCASEYHINSNKVITFLNNGSVVQHSFPFFVNVNNDTVYDFLHPASTILCNSLLPSYYYSSKKRKELAKIALSENGKFAAFVGVKNNDVFFAELESCKKTGRSEASTGGIVNAKDLIFYKSVPICSFEDGTIAEWSCSSPSQKKNT